MTRIARAIRMQYTNATTYFWVPAMVAVLASIISVLIALIVPTTGAVYTAAANAPVWFFAAAGVQSILLMLPFASAMGVTRWEYSASTLGAAFGAAGILGLLGTVLGWLEDLTGGWFVGVYTFNLPWFWQQEGPVTWLLFTSVCLVVFQIAFALTVVYKRYGMVPMVLLLFGLMLVIVFLTWVTTRNNWWPRVLEFLAGLTPLTVSLGCLGLAVLISGLAFLALRRYEIR